MTAAAGFVAWLEGEMRRAADDHADRCNRWQAARDDGATDEDVELWAALADNAARYRRRLEDTRLAVAGACERLLLRRMGQWEKTW